MYLILIKFLLVIPLAADFIAYRSGVMDKFKFWLFYRMYSKRTRYMEFRIKPFDCTMCLSFWISLCLVTDYTQLIYPFAAATAGALISKL